MQKDKLLSIDDEERLRKLLARILQLEGYEVSVASTGKEGLKKLQQEAIPVVISDVKLPDINGIELILANKSKLASYRNYCANGIRYHKRRRKSNQIGCV